MEMERVGRPKSPSKRSEVVATRLLPSEVELLDKMRGSITRSQYLALLIRKAYVQDDK